MTLTLLLIALTLALTAADIGTTWVGLTRLGCREIGPVPALLLRVMSLSQMLALMSAIRVALIFGVAIYTAPALTGLVIFAVMFSLAVINNAFRLIQHSRALVAA